MIRYIFLDTNIYIDSRYSFENPRMKKLSEYINREHIHLLVCNVLIGEVEKHINNDLGCAISELNKVLKMKEFAPIRYELVYKERMEKISEKEIIDFVIAKFHDFLTRNNKLSFTLDGISVEEVMQDYFNQNPPFEMSKPKEFKDAIMIKALKNYQKSIDENIVVISNDKGFSDALKNFNEFVLFEKLDDYFKYAQDDVIYTRLQKTFDDDTDYDAIMEALQDLAQDFSFEYDEREEFEVIGVEVDDVSYDFDYSELGENNSIKAYITVCFSVEIKCKYLDINNSYYDKEDDEYIIKSYVHSKEKHHFDQEIVLEYSYDVKEEDIELSFNCVCIDSDGISIDLSNDDTLYDCVEEHFLMSDKDRKWYEDNSVKCSECGKFLGFNDNGNYHDFNGEPICDNCAETNENGFICSMCGYKHPYNNMGNSGQYCIDCESEYDV